MDEVEEFLEAELQEAVNNLEIEEGDDEQDMLLTMIRNLQLKAFGRGLSMNSQSEDEQAVYMRMDAEDVALMFASLVKGGSVKITLDATR